MSFYADILFAEALFGSDELSLPPGGPTNLNAYQNNIDTVVLYWALTPCTPTFPDFVWTVQTDTSDSFSGGDLRTYVTTDSKITLAGALVTGNTVEVDVDAFTVSVPFATDSNATLGALADAIALRPNVASATVIDAGSGTDDDRAILVRSSDIENPVVLNNFSVTGGASQTTAIIGLGVDFIVGKLNKGVAVPIYDRAQGSERVMHWRVKGIYGGSETATISSTFNIPMAIDGVARDAMLDLMPDPIYKKSSDSNNYKMHWVFGNALDDHYIGDVFANNDISLELVRDVSIQGKFGDVVRIRRPQLMKVIDFREIVKQFFAEARNSPTVAAVRDVVRASLCETPTITQIRDTLDFYVNDTTVGQEVEEFWASDIGVDEPAAWDNTHLASGIIVEVTNPLGAIVSRDFLQEILRKLVNAHSPLYVIGIP